MKLSKLYSNKSEIFGPIDFVQGLNVVMAEIRSFLRKPCAKDTHNLGKHHSWPEAGLRFSLLARTRSLSCSSTLTHSRNSYFAFEIELSDASFLTVRRGVEEATKISFKKHEASHQDFSALPDSAWDHFELPFDRAKEMLDSLLDWRSLKPWSYRKGRTTIATYFTSTSLPRRHPDWKPFLAHTLGFNAELVNSHYAKEEELTQKHATVHTITNELGGSVEDLSKIEGLLLLKKEEAQEETKTS